MKTYLMQICSSLNHSLWFQALLQTSSSSSSSCCPIFAPQLLSQRDAEWRHYMLQTDRGHDVNAQSAYMTSFINPFLPLICSQWNWRRVSGCSYRHNKDHISVAQVMIHQVVRQKQCSTLTRPCEAKQHNNDKHWFYFSLDTEKKDWYQYWLTV